MTLFQFLNLCVFLNFRYSSKYSTQIKEPSMGPPCWCTSVEHQHGGRKIVQTSGTYFGSLGDLLNGATITCTEQKSMYIIVFPNTLKRQCHEDFAVLDQF